MSRLINCLKKAKGYKSFISCLIAYRLHCVEALRYLGLIRVFLVWQPTDTPDGFNTGFSDSWVTVVGMDVLTIFGRLCVGLTTCGIL